MRFSLSLPVLTFDETCALAQVAEEHGFDTATIGHHHFMPGNLSDPLTYLAAVAARTTTLRVGTGIFQLPIHHPVRVAEQVATIDQLSGGRVSLGVGLGWWPLEYQVHGSDFRTRGARMEEALEILRLVWTTEEAAFDGRFWSFPSLTVQPRPVQSPHPPLWVAGVADTAIDRAARLGDAWLCGPVQSISKAESMLDVYRAACARAGRPASWILRRYAWVTPTRDEGEVMDYVGGLVEHWRESVEDADDQQAFDTQDARQLADDRLLWGTPDDVIAQIQRYVEVTGADHVHAAFGAGLPGWEPQASKGGADTIADMIRLFGREVVPAFS